MSWQQKFESITLDEIKNTKFDAVIIGAGLGGLTVGNYLVYHGYKVLIVDKNHHPGGYVINFQRGDFRFDSSIHFINGCGPNGMVDNIFKQFGGQGIVEWLPITNLIHWVDTENKFEARPPTPMKEYTEWLCQEFPEEAKNIRKFVNRYSKIMPTLFGMLTPGLLNKMKLFIKGFPTFVRFLLTATATVDDITKKYFKNPALIELLTLFVSPFGMTREKESNFIWVLNEFSYHLEGAWYPKGGAGEFTTALARHYEKNGGKFLLNTEVIHIDVDQKTMMATGLVCKDKKGNEFKLDGTMVVNAADLYRLQHDLVSPGVFKEKWLKKLDSRATIQALIMVYLGLDIDLKDYGITDYEYWQVNQQYRAPEVIDDIFQKMKYDKLPCEVITIYSNGPDKSCCPPGKSCLSTLAGGDLKVWESLLEDGKKGDKYRDFKKETAKVFIQKFADIFKIPDLEKHIEVIEIATPVTLYRYSYAHRGTPIGYAFDVDSVKKTQTYGTRIKNLSLAGHFCFPGGGMSATMMGGIQAAKAAEKRIKKYSK